MDDLGKRIIADRAQISFNRTRADEFERQARVLRSEADEIERLLELARQNKPSSTPKFDAMTPVQQRHCEFMGFDPDNPDVPLD